MTTSVPVPALDRDLIGRLRADVIASTWTVENLQTLISEGALSALMRDSRLPALVELAGATDPAAVLTRFFILGLPERASALNEALPTLGAHGLGSLGLAATIDEAEAASALVMPRAGGAPKREPRDKGADKASALKAPSLPTMRDPDEEAPEPEAEADPWMRALFDLRPHAATLPGGDHEWWVASDLAEVQTGKPLSDDHVLGIGGATLTLLEMTVREQVDSALDVGCGCGIQALYLATHADRVVATDLSSRACALTQFNAALNEAVIDVREGSLFEPVEGETFDLIVTNPPFVITPDSVRGAAGLLEYRDGGMDRDNLIRAVLRGAPACMNEGGALQMLANWEIPADRNPDTQWSWRVDSWLDGLPVDAWVVQRDVLDPARYVDMWIRDSGGQLMARADYERAFTSWLADFRRAGTGAIGMGFVALRRLDEAEAASGGKRAYDLSLDGHAPRGRDVAWALASLRAPELWDTALTRASDVREERHYVPGSPDPELIIMHQGGGLGRSVPVSSSVSAVVGASDGELTVGQIAAAVAMLTSVEVDDVRAEIEAPLRDLIRWGFLTY
ncbi:ribosomal protein L11 methyltransferase-like protein [Actinomyces sp. ICM54]|uniref:methyltransferase n=1 Tax=Actinomyces sp. ICM54 TaxID=936549 RepID=UPI00044E34CF|nr:methyltransferase [Actinomyces sp. ICM54]EWC98595.1 ribosomal protein L11 methyltransferase-like protein [Actinomyces sp. ICM54]